MSTDDFAECTMSMMGHDIDLMDAKTFHDGIPHDYFRALRRRTGLHYAHDPAGYGFWNLVRHREVVAASRNTAVFSSSPSTMTSVRQESTGLPIIIFLDGPEHTRLRRLIAKGFAAPRLNGLERRIRGVADRLLTEMSAAVRFDLAGDVALRLPTEVLAEFIGVPQPDRADLLAWCRRIINLGDVDYHHDNAGPGPAFEKIFGYLLSLAQRRAADPADPADPADDLFSVLLSTSLQGDQLSPTEIAHFATSMLNAGIETIYGSLTSGVLALLEHPDQLALLRVNRELIPRAVEEILRWVTPVMHFARNVTQDVELAGQPIRAGERVILWYTSANRDETVFDAPERFDITRRPNPHIAFGGGGPHACIGAYLAIMQLRCFLESWLDRLGELELTDEPTRAQTNFMNSHQRMPVTFG